MTAKSQNKRVVDLLLQMARLGTKNENAALQALLDAAYSDTFDKTWDSGRETD